MHMCCMLPIHVTAAVLCVPMRVLCVPMHMLCLLVDEIGDTWVFGVQSDPLKTANFRAASRLRAACITDPHCPSEVRQGGARS
jgi:hypothetical protein